MDIHEDINAILDKVYEALNAHDPAAVARMAADDVVVEDIPLGRVAKGQQAVVEHYRRAFQAFPDLRYQSLNRVRQGDTIVDEWQMRGTHKGEVQLGKLGIKPTNKTLELRGVSIFVFHGGNVRHQRLYYDVQAVRRQLGDLSALKAREAGGQSNCG